MKFGSFEGSSEELKDIVENHGFKPENFLDNSPRFIPNIWAVYILSGILTILFISLSIFDLNDNLKKAFIIISFVLLIANSSLIHLKFNNWFVTSLIFIGGIIILSLSLNIVTTEQALKELKEIKIQK